MENPNSGLFNELVSKKADCIAFVRVNMELAITSELLQIPVQRPELKQFCTAGVYVKGYFVNMQRYDSDFLPADDENGFKYSKTVLPRYAVTNVNISILELTRSKDFRQGTHGMLPVLQYPEGEIIVKSIKKKQFNSMKEVMGMVHIQNTGISPAVYLIVETDDMYDVYMEMVSPGVTLQDVLNCIKDINPQLTVKFVHYIIHQLVKYMNMIWDKRWSHKDLHVGNILIAESNQCVDLKITDFGNAAEIKDSSYEYISNDVIGIYDMISMLLKEHPEIDFKLKEYETKKEQFLSKKKIMELMSTVTILAEEFVKSRAANKVILEWVYKFKTDYVPHRNNQTRTGQDETFNVRSFFSLVCGMDCVNDEQ